MTTTQAHGTSAETALTVGPLNVLIIGGASSIGLETVRALRAAGHRVTATVDSAKEAGLLRRAGALPTYPGRTRAGELRAAIATAEASVVINLAPQAANYTPHAAASWNAEALAAETAALVAAASQAGVAHLVHTSYAFAAGESEAARPLIQAARRAERAVLRGGVPATVLRFGYLYGPGSAALAGVRRALSAGQPLTLGSSVPAGWVYESDAACALALAAAAQPSGAVLTIVDDRPVSPADFLHYFAQAQGLTAPGLPGFVQRLLADKTQAALMEVPFTGSSAEARAALGWQPRYSTVQAGVDDALLTWRAAEAAR